ncbi:hypothetical protein BSR29_06455 [Boudabousia liubingyangii]|uniref:Methyltransferase type 11 domain-containing protein n=1 Tax=Boudabousia liubingyangii TaxID=1921764 RepID=A0A1Q5PKU4_9ACTO|nr:class I SAM-dependent methyltransferase [Boudabousia liubingyangii]OKL47256.1 hypothetical protein BSR29_06455 [Boudabousia liubingyangii]
MNTNPYEQPAPEYEPTRPAYPPKLVQELVQAASYLKADSDKPTRILELGAGTGKMTRQLLELGCEVVAVEPSPSMCTTFNSNFGESDQVTLIQTTAEQLGDTELEGESFDAAVFAQSWHWVDPEVTSSMLARLLKPEARVWILFNQLDVSIPWVHRLSRIMRSGDVHRVSHVPQLSEHFSEPELQLSYWTQRCSTQEVLALGRTRSAYLKGSPEYQRKMQENLLWYLSEHLELGEGPILLPYTTLAWSATKTES